MEEVELDAVCRLCLDVMKESFDICTTCDDGISLKEKICATLGIQFDIPTQCVLSVCRDCFNKVCDFYDFYDQVHRNNSHFIGLSIEDGKDEAVARVSVDSELIVESESVDFKNTEDNINLAPFNEEFLELDNEDVNEPNPDAPKSPSNNKLYDVPIQLRRDLSDTKIELPEHLKKRISKATGDAKIKEFIDLKCAQCGPKQPLFNTFKEMQLHYEQYHNTRGYISCCGKKIYRKDRAMDHITVHVDPNAFRCPVCGHNSKSRVLLRIHMKQHLPSEEWPFECSKCSQKFVLKSQLTNHEATHLTDGEKKFVCDECGKVFALKFVLIKHKQTHSRERKFFCKTCAKSFSNQASLAAHVKQHENRVGLNPRVQCNFCGLWYKNMQTLRTHENRHRDTREHVCEICHRKCSSKSSLSAHIRYVHVKTSQWECSICSKRFRRKPELTEHVARHTGNVLYTCPYCPKTFYSSSNFFAHRKSKHSGERKKQARQQSSANLKCVGQQNEHNEPEND